MGFLARIVRRPKVGRRQEGLRHPRRRNIDPNSLAGGGAMGTANESCGAAGRRVDELHAIAGTLPTPLSSSRSRGWDGIVAEHYRAGGVDVVSQANALLVTLHLGAPVVMTQTRCGRVHRRRIGKGDMTLTPPGEPKGWRHEETSDALCIWLAPEQIEALAAETGARRPDQVRIQDNFGTLDRRVEQFGLALLSELECEQPGGRACAGALAVALGVHVLRHYSTLDGAVRESRGGLPAFKLRRAVEYIDEHLCEDVSLFELAHAVQMTPYHFARGFKQATGRAPHQYLIERRIERAAALLRSTDMPISEIARRVGCASQSHFSMMFRRATASAPRAFRQQYRGAGFGAPR